MSEKAKNVVKLITSLVICQVAGLIGSIFTAPAIATWYVTLQKPPFTPPNWLFAPAWSTLYLLMGTAAFLIWRQGLGTARVKPALITFAVQLVLNISWSAAFFGLKSPVAGLIVIVMLWVAILLTMLRFYRLSSLAGTLLVPYILWVSFATALNAAIFILNQ